MALGTRDLSTLYIESHPSISLVDQEAITTSTAAEVIAWLLACVSAGTMTGMSYRFFPSDAASDGWFDGGHWCARALFAFDKHRASATAGEVSIISAWLLEQATYMMGMQTSQLAAVFPNRASDDYSVTAGAAASGTLNSSFLYLGGPQIPDITLFYNNRRSSCAHYIGQAGIYFGDAAMIAEAKLYFKEWVMFAVYPSGVQSEWNRNDNYGDPKAGLVYSMYSMAGALEIAARTAAIGDRELADFSTTYGLWGTASTTPKTIYTALDLFIEITKGRRYYTPARNPINWWTNNFGLACHWQWCIEPAKTLGIENKFSTIRQVVTPGGWSEDHAFAPWRGFCGMYPSDVRVGLPPVIQARLG